MALLLVVLVALPCLGDEPQAAPNHRPNILLITIDTCRADYLGCYGRTLARTRCIDSLAAEGVRFANAATAAPITLPSHASILTGLLPPAHGVRDNGAYALSDKAVTLAERLKEAGYATHAAVSALVLAKQYNLTQGFDSYDDDLSEEDAPPMFMIPDRPAQRTSARVLAWLDQWWNAKGGAEPGQRPPFFLWAHFFDPHQPWEAQIPDRHLCPTPYDAEIAQADHGVDALITWLRGKGILDDTFVILTADHGESLGEHKEKTHAIFIYDATIRVPLILRYPRLLPQGLVARTPTRTIDLVPTILSALGLPGAESTQGTSLLARLKDSDADVPGLPQYSESLLSEVGFGMAPLFGIRMNGYKFVRAPRPELYDLGHDPGELTNVITQNPDVATKLAHELDATLAACSKHALDPVANPMDAQTAQMLEALGYLAPRESRAEMAGIDPKDGIEIYTKLEDARNLVRHGDLKESERLLREIIALAPNHSAALNVLGGVLAQQGRLGEAEEIYQHSLNASPRQYRVLLSLGKLAERQGRPDTAERWLQQALELAPRCLDAMISLSCISEDRGNTATAAEWRTKAEAEAGGEPLVPLALADQHFARKQFAKALGAYEEVLRRRSTHFHALLQAGVCAGKLQRTKDAEEFYRKAMRARADSWMPPYNLACLAALSGDPGAAAPLLRTAIEKADAKSADATRARAMAKTDPDLATLRAAPAFDKLLETGAAPSLP